MTQLITLKPSRPDWLDPLLERYKTASGSLKYAIVWGPDREGWRGKPCWVLEPKPPNGNSYLLILCGQPLSLDDLGVEGLRQRIDEIDKADNLCALQEKLDSLFTRACERDQSSVDKLLQAVSAFSDFVARA